MREAVGERAPRKVPVRREQEAPVKEKRTFTCSVCSSFTIPWEEHLETHEASCKAIAEMKAKLGMKSSQRTDA